MYAEGVGGLILAEIALALGMVWGTLHRTAAAARRRGVSIIIRLWRAIELTVPPTQVPSSPSIRSGRSIQIRDDARHLRYDAIRYPPDHSQHGTRHKSKITGNARHI